MRKQTSPRFDLSSILLDAGLVVWVLALTLSATVELPVGHSPSTSMQPHRIGALYAASFDARWKSLHAAKATNYWLTPGPHGHPIRRAEEVHT